MKTLFILAASIITLACEQDPKPIADCDTACAYLEMGYEEAEEEVKRLGCICPWDEDGSQSRYQ